MRVCSLILARGGSKGLADKNIYPLDGKPLISYTIEASLLARNVNRTIVSTDSEKIANVAIECGAEVPFLRPKEFSGDHATSEDALLHAVNWLDNSENYIPDIIVYLQPTDIFRTVDMIEKCVDELSKDFTLDSVFMGQVSHKNFWIKDGNEFRKLNSSAYSHQPRQTKLPILREDTGIALATRTNVIKSGKRIGKNVKILPYESDTNFVDIHTKFDIELAELLIKNMNKKPNKEI